MKKQIGEIDNQIRKSMPTKLKNLRKGFQISVFELSKDLKISYFRIFLYEHGLKQLTCKDMIKYSKYFKVSCDYLLGLTDKK